MKNYKAYVIGTVPVWENHEVEVLGTHHLPPEKLSEVGYELMIYLANQVQDTAKRVQADTVLINFLSPVVATALVYMAHYQQFYLRWGIVESRIIRPTISRMKLPPDRKLPSEFMDLMKKASRISVKDDVVTITGKIIHTCHNIHWL